MKKSYINPNTECIALQSGTIMQNCLGVSGGGTGGPQGDARAPQHRVGSLYI